jgi:hypothetical protein
MRAACLVSLFSILLISCQDASPCTGSPLAPSPGGTPFFSGTPNGAVALKLGEVVTGTIAGNESTCNANNPTVPIMLEIGVCRIYTATIPRDGTLTATAAWQDPFHVMNLWIIPPGWNGGVSTHPPPDSSGRLVGNHLTVNFYHAVAGSTLGVIIDLDWSSGPDIRETFELSTSLEPD